MFIYYCGEINVQKYSHLKYVTAIANISNSNSLRIYNKFIT